jgi:hypothetical protein
MLDTPYDRYITWRRLTHNGHRKREQMNPQEQAEYDDLRSYAQSAPPIDHEEAKRAYEEVTGRSVPESA